MKEILKDIFLFIINFFGWPFIIPFLISIVSWFVAKLNTLDQDLVSKEDSNKYGTNMNNLIITEQKGGLFYHLPTFFLSHSIWGISTLSVNMQSQEIIIYPAFMVMYIMLLLWSVALILHSNIRSNIKNNRTTYNRLKIHSLIAVSFFIFCRLIIYYFTDGKI